MLKSSLFVAFFLAAFTALNAQYVGPRLFLDVPSIYLHTPDVENLKNRVGAGAEVAMNVGTHWSMARLGLGTTFTFNPNDENFNETTLWGPYGLLEAGAGLYRTNGNQCTKDHQSAFTAIGKAGVRYDFNSKAVVSADDAEPQQLDFTLGVELGYFYIRDEFRNMDFVISGNYLTKAKVISVNFGFKFFLNLRERV
ncbi:MAG: hypothetical protein EP344_00685 [Bacteroidetes bacterium]|nr:MAG: hypothetical protein EP344_00685 [Bacteroidota bacterium]